MPINDKKHTSPQERQDIASLVNALNKSVAFAINNFREHLPKPRHNAQLEKAADVAWSATATYLATNKADRDITNAWIRVRECNTHTFAPLDCPDTPTKGDKSTPH